MSKRTVLQVDTSCAKCKRKVLLAVSGLQGVDKIEVDSEKGTMTVTGGVDPVDVVEATRRKAGKRADVLTIGPPPSAPTASSAKPEEKKKPEQQQQKPQQHWEPDKKHAAAERSAPEPPVTVYVHHVPAPPPSWPAYEQCAVVPYHYQQQQDPCSIM